jgi:hypothetical protein
METQVAFKGVIGWRGVDFKWFWSTAFKMAGAEQQKKREPNLVLDGVEEVIVLVR